jgi:hypothetical protein
MSWNAVVAGELRFARDGLARWQAAAGSLPEHEWPQFIANTIEDDDDDEYPPGSPELTVAGRLETCNALCPSFLFDLDEERDSVRIRALVGKDEFWGVVNDVVRIVGAAAQLGASGRVFLRYLGTGFGYDDGVVLQLTGGQLASERIESEAPPSEEDWAAMQESYERGQAALEELTGTAKPKPDSQEGDSED